ncbi:MAG: AarF/UbiB family protein, partial [Chloroflexota bacterium]
MLEELGTTYIKLGQIAGSQYSAIPREIGLELEKLQDDIPPFPAEKVRRIVTAELGASPSEVFQSFDEMPIAAASIAQVHCAVTHDGKQIVLKVQRPGIRDDIEADLEIMKVTAQVVEGTVGRNRGLLEMIDEFKISLERELDFRNEGRNADRLRYNLRDLYGVNVPRIYWDYTTDRVLAMDYIDGVKITDVQTLGRAGLEMSSIAETFTRAMSQQILIDGFFHGDPHPGNVIVDTKSGEITYLDLGMMGYLDEETRHELSNMMIALQAPDTRELVNIFMRIGVSFGDVDRRSLNRQLEHILNQYIIVSLSEVSFADMMYEMMNVLFDHGIRLPAKLTLAIKAMVQTQEISSTLNPD